MKEKRRFVLAKRQVMLARMARRTAMSALADALTEEARSAEIAGRSRELLSHHGQRSGADLGQTLIVHAAFTHSLHDIANKAEQSRSDASEQARWQRDALAAAETRLSLSEEKAASALKQVDAAKERRDAAATIGLARNLQSFSKADPKP